MFSQSSIRPNARTYASSTLIRNFYQLTSEKRRPEQFAERWPNQSSAERHWGSRSERGTFLNVFLLWSSRHPGLYCTIKLWSFVNQILNAHKTMACIYKVVRVVAKARERCSSVFSSWGWPVVSLTGTRPLAVHRTTSLWRFFTPLAGSWSATLPFTLRMWPYVLRVFGWWSEDRRCNIRLGGVLCN